MFSLKFRQDIVSTVAKATSILGSSLTSNLPNIVMIGAQSAGKTTALSCILGRPLGHTDATLATRRPNVITTHRLPEGDTPYVTFGNDPRKFFSDEDVHARLKALNNVEHISNIPIHTHVYDPEAEPTVMVDCPGRQLQSADDHYPEMKDHIDAIIAEYAGNPHNILAIVQVASVDRAASLGVNSAHLFDRFGERSLGLLTKVDTAGAYHPGSPVEEACMGTVHKKRHGTFGLACRVPPGGTVADAILGEEECFKRLGYDAAPFRDRLGVHNVRAALSSIYVQHMLDQYPTFRVDLVALREQRLKDVAMLQSIQQGGRHDALVREVERVLDVFHRNSDDRLAIQTRLVEQFYKELRSRMRPESASGQDGGGGGEGELDLHVPFPHHLAMDGARVKFDMASPFAVRDPEEFYRREFYRRGDATEYFNHMTMFGDGPNMDLYHPELVRQYDRKARFETTAAAAAWHWQLPESGARQKRNEFCRRVQDIFSGLLESTLLEQLNAIYLSEIQTSFHQHTRHTSSQFFKYAVTQVNRDLFDSVLRPHMEGIVSAELHPLTSPARLSQHLPRPPVWTNFLRTHYVCQPHRVEFFSEWHLHAHLSLVAHDLANNLARCAFGPYFDQLNHHTLRFAFENLGTASDVEAQIEAKTEEVSAVDGVLAVMDEAMSFVRNE